MSNVQITAIYELIAINTLFLLISAIIIFMGIHAGFITGRKLSQGLARTDQVIERLCRIVMVVHRKALINNLSENFLVHEFL